MAEVSKEEVIEDIVAMALGTSLARDIRMRYVACPDCSSLISLTRKRNTTSYRCPVCHSVFAREELEKIWRISSGAVYYGWMYYRAYDEQLKKYGKIRIYYCLAPPDPFIVYLASIVVSGIVGGLAYDGFKKVLNKIRRETRHNAKTDQTKRRMIQSLDKMSEKELNEFYGDVVRYVKTRHMKRIKKIPDRRKKGGQDHAQ
jgi:hypothetical protein